LVRFETRHVLSKTDHPEIGTGAARRYLEDRLRALIPASDGRRSVSRDNNEVDCARRGMPRKVTVVNVVARLAGATDPERVYIVGGHYDSRNSDGADGSRAAPGANDDGSGTAVVVEACRVMCASMFTATIEFVCYDGEEQGLLGSSAHAERLAREGVRVDGMITNDIVGNTLGMDGVRRDDWIRCFSFAPRDSDSTGRSLARAATHADRLVEGLSVKLVFRGDRYGRGGDHRPFFQQGFPAIRFTEPREDFSRQHQDVTERDGRPYGDVPDYVDFGYAARVVALNVALLGELASAPPPPNNVRANGARESYDTIVSWSAIDGVGAYEVVWRDTTAPDWEGILLLPGESLGSRRGMCTATVPGVCLDDVVVGVRSVGADGSRSRVATPAEPDALAARTTGGR
jgi:hypothetical protein